MRIEQFHSIDLEAVAELWNRSLLADPISANRLRERVLLDPNFRDEFCLVAREGGDIIGFILGICGDGFHFPGGLSGERAWILGMAVDLEHRGKGIGATLLRELEHHFRDSGKREIWIASYPTAYIVPGVDVNAYPDGITFFQENGFKIAHTAISMDAVIWPYGYPAEVTQKEKKLAEQGICFSGYSSSNLSAFRQFLRNEVPWDWEWLALRNLSRISEGTFSPEQFRLAIFQDAVVGYCQYEGEHFGPFGVSQDFQRRGIGTVLLANALDSMMQQGIHNAWVLWTGEGTARLYERFGFRKSREFAILHKEL